MCRRVRFAYNLSILFSRKPALNFNRVVSDSLDCSI